MSGSHELALRARTSMAKRMTDRWFGGRRLCTTDAADALCYFGMHTVLAPGGRTTASTRLLMCHGSPVGPGEFLRAVDRARLSGRCGWKACTTSTETPVTLQCGGCHIQVYCSKDCQRKAKKVCSAMASKVSAAATELPSELPVGASVRLVGLASAAYLNGRDGVVVSALAEGRHGVRLLQEDPALPPQVVSIRPVNLIQAAPHSDAFGHAGSGIAVIASAPLAHLHFGWAAAAKAKGSPPPALHIEFGDDTVALGFSTPYQWRVTPYHVPALTASHAGGVGVAHWLDSTSAGLMFAKLALGLESRPEADAIQSGEGIFVIVTLARPDARYVHAVLLRHQVPLSELRAARDTVRAAASEAAALLRSGSSINSLSSRATIAYILETCIAMCVEPTVDTAEAAGVRSSQKQALVSHVIGGDIDPISKALPGEMPTGVERFALGFIVSGDAHLYA